MGKLIQDIIPFKKQSFDVNDIPEKVFQEVEASRLPTGVMVEELFNRGVSIEDIFGIYYALEEMGNARSDEIFGNDEEGQHGRPKLTVGDALLVNPSLNLSFNPNPF